MVVQAGDPRPQVVGGGGLEAVRRVWKPECPERLQKQIAFDNLIFGGDQYIFLITNTRKNCDM